jgi:soluble lytic murein transglycosylase-like protein
MWDIINIHARKYDLPPSLVGAIVQTESNWIPWAIRYESEFKERLNVSDFARMNHISNQTEFFLQACSIGVMQTLGVVARELGFKKNLLMLTDPDLSISLGCKKLHILVRSYGEIDDAIASYNAGSPRFSSRGQYINQEYVDKVKKCQAELSRNN